MHRAARKQVKLSAFFSLGSCLSGFFQKHAFAAKAYQEKQNDADKEKGAYSKDGIPPAVGLCLVLFHFQGLDLGFLELGQEVSGGLVGISRGIFVGEKETAGDLTWG